MREKLRIWVLGNKLELGLIFALFMFFLALNVLYSYHVSTVIIDIGRELYFPQEMLSGKVLYKDMFNIFGPLSYQINTVFCRFMGLKLSTFRLVGSLNALLVMYLFYGILRVYTTKWVSFAVTLFLTSSCIYNVWSLNYIFPYTYAMPYAFCAFLASFLCLSLYFKTEKSALITMAWFFAGVSVSIKYDYLIYYLCLLVITFFFISQKKLNFKDIFYCSLSFISVPLLSFSILFWQGLKIYDLWVQAQYLLKFSMSPSLHFIYNNVVGASPQKDHILYALNMFFNVFGNLFLLCLGVHFIFSPINRKLSKYYFIFLGVVLAGVSLNNLYYHSSINPYRSIAWLPILNLIGLLFVVGKIIFEKNIKCNLSWLCLFLIPILLSGKVAYFLSFDPYGIYVIPLLFISGSIFLIELLPNMFDFIDKCFIRKFFVIVLLGITLQCLFLTSSLSQSGYLLKSKRGNLYNNSIFLDNIDFYMNKSNAVVTQKVIDYINKNLKPEDTLWVIPEGVTINFLTNHFTNGIYYNLIPPYVETFGEDKIIQDTKNNSPDYIIINSRDCSDYGYKKICENYAFKICEYVHSAYEEKAEFSEFLNANDYFSTVIYKKK